MLRAFLAALIVANLLFFAFTRGWLDGVTGLHALGDREPERLGRQVHPESIVLLPVGAAASAQAEATTCYEAGPFGVAESTAIEAVLKTNLPAGAWSDNRSESQGVAGILVTHTYRVTSANAALAARLASLKLDASGRGFSPCVKAERPR
ncbi:MAG: hypothetical protein ABJA61_03875 [Caldimonas sp.]